ncbi:hypothetical protein FCH28_06460 [Streptomyces piniterrae]|uniref:Uncharacterized protein n=1 Tax=Streptomyces piniterrae TaxID=2571125 RepID=A0A4U0NRJ0_9ACTN|nr:hypothetical protein [Streptomyces piniterrae]TJZ57103.1 hypothetical protein FCH28_06460 [Streptomyces piniterrae]
MPASRAAIGRDDLRLKVAVQHVRMGGEEFRVMRPAKPLKNGALYKTRNSYDMYVDRADGRRIGTLWLLAARSPRTLLYLPMRTTPPAPGIGWGEEQPLDLVLAHRSVQFRPSRWKRLRERINAGNAAREIRTASVPESDLPTDEENEKADKEKDYATTRNHRNQPFLRQHFFAETLFLTGDTSAFRDAAGDVFAVTKEGPPAAATRLYLPGGCNYHVCRGLYYWSDVHAHEVEQFHVEFSPPWTK